MNRVTDLMLSDIFYKNLNRTKNTVGEIQNNIATGVKINKPSDSPTGTSKLLSFYQQKNDLQLYAKNIDSALAFANTTVSTMGDIQTEIQKILVNLTELNNPINAQEKDSYIQEIEFSLKNIIDLANGEFEGKYLFAGTNYSDKPFNQDVIDNSVTFASNIDGEQKIKIGKNVDQKINISGAELFQSVLNQIGNLDSSSSIGASTNLTQEIFDADGNSYSFQANYTKTAAQEYSLSYSIIDSNGITIFTDSNNLKFNATTGSLETIDGDLPKPININLPSNKINLIFNPTSLVEKNSSTTITNHLNQKTDVLNTIASIIENLKNGNEVNNNQMNIINDFNSLILNKISEEGTIINRLEDAKNLNEQQDIEIQKLISRENDVDIVKASIDLQSNQFTLDLLYKISSSILPKSILDYL
ncbi:MAG: hypothetical protein STSR0008_15520 [Ignavibacterium sp.]